MKATYRFFGLRALVVGSKPALVLALAMADEVAANELSRLMIWAAFTTAAASLSYYKTYMPLGINNGLRSVLPQITTHTSYVACAFFLIATMAKLESIIFLVLTIDFTLHQFSRVLLYQKRIYWWFFVSIILTPVLIAILLLQNLFPALIDHMSLVVICLFAVGVAESLRKFDSFSSKFEISQSFLGLGRKLILSMDKLLASVLVDSNSFWVLGIIYQLSNASQTAFDATKMMPIKREIALKQLNFREIDVASHNIFWATISALFAGAFLFSQNANFSLAVACFFVFLLRGVSANFFSFTMEIFFWRHRLGRITLMMLCCACSYCGVVYWLGPAADQYSTAFGLTMLASLVALAVSMSTRADCIRLSTTTG